MNTINQEQFANAWQQGTYDQLPHQDAWQNYTQFAQSAPPQEVEQAHQQVYTQMSPEQRGSLLQNLLSGLAQRGVTPQQLGIQNTDPYTMSPSDAARVTSYAQQQAPDLLQQIFGPGGVLNSPLGKLIVAGVAAYAANRFLGGANPFGAGGSGNQAPTRSQGGSLTGHSDNQNGIL